MNASDRGSELWAVAAGKGKSATEVRDHLVKFIDSDDGISLLNQRGKRRGGWMVVAGG